MMNYELPKISDDLMKEFLKLEKEVLNNYLRKKISAEELSDFTVDWWVRQERLSKELLSLNPKIKELASGMDVTHPGWSEEKKEQLVKKLLGIVEELGNE